MRAHARGAPRADHASVAPGLRPDRAPPPASPPGPRRSARTPAPPLRDARRRAAASPLPLGGGVTASASAAAAGDAAIAGTRGAHAMRALAKHRDASRSSSRSATRMASPPRAAPAVWPASRTGRRRAPTSAATFAAAAAASSAAEAGGWAHAKISGGGSCRHSRHGAGSGAASAAAKAGGYDAETGPSTPLTARPVFGSRSEARPRAWAPSPPRRSPARGARRRAGRTRRLSGAPPPRRDP